MSSRRGFAVLARALLFALALLTGCTQGSASSGAAPAASLAGPRPTAAAEAEALKRGGASWSNAQIRGYYNELVAAIGPANERWIREGLSAEERARRAFQIRHEARLTARAMMASADEVEDLRRRDREKYGQPDGPTFDQLVESAKKKGVTGDAIFEGIIASAQRTDEATNAAFGIKK